MHHKTNKRILKNERQAIGFKAKMDRNKKLGEKFADFFTDTFGTIQFLIFNIILFFFWITSNLGLIPQIPIFDPPPHILLTTIVSLEAIFLSIVVLISQRRTNQIDDLREELDLQINIKSEREVTRILTMLDEIHDHLGLKKQDDFEFKKMKEKTNVEKIREELLEEMKKNK